ncbi:MAG: TIGR01620 family protein [Pseudomonadota bacterium]
MAKGPVLIDLDTPPPSPADAPPVPDSAPLPDGAAMQLAAKLAARRPSTLARAFWAVLVALLGAIVSIAAYDFAAALIARSPVLGWALTALFAVLIALGLALALRELAALMRLGRLDALRHAAGQAREAEDMAAARRVADRLVGLYANRDETRWARERFAELRGGQVDAAALLDLADGEILAPLDARAAEEVQAAARQVATVTALVPLALADVVAALTANLRMIRRIAEIYGGVSGWLGGWRLTRAVLSHLVATGAVAVGDDLLEPFLGSSLLGKLSRRFGEGLVNGALTARVGVAAMEVCRPLPFAPGGRPKARTLVRGALAGLMPGSS